MSSVDRFAALLEPLKAGHAAGRLAHAHVLIGDPRGEAQAFAIAFAQLVFCEGLTPPCGDCPACERVADHLHPDLVWLEPEKKSRIIDIDTIRDLLSRLSQKAFIAGGWKVAIIEHADRMKEAAANAFLKTLEEPPPRTLILLLTDSPQALMATILSRCQRLQIQTGERRVDRKWTPALLDLLAEPMGGGVLERIGRARQITGLLDAERERIGKEVDAEIRKLDEPPPKEVREARVDSEVKKVRSEMLHTMILWSRDVLAIHFGADPACLHFPERQQDLKTLSNGQDSTSLMQAIHVQKTLIRRMERVAKFENQSLEAYFLSFEKNAG